MQQSITQVDAFTAQPFKGNPAAVCLLSEPQSEAWMQLVAQEMNLSETAFLVPQVDGFNLRWFTPATEVPLCGHATLASAHVLWSEGHLPAGQAARFHTQSGLLIAQQQGTWIEMDFPVVRSTPAEITPDLQQALGVPVKSVVQCAIGYLLVEVESATQVQQIQPNFAKISALPRGKVIVTSLADSNSEYDFVSRFFAPGVGVNEDPVTGSAHCCLAAFWRDRLGQDQFLAYQASQRGGVVKVRYDGGDRVFLAGQAVTVLRGTLLGDIV
ncbi:MAG: PhzF family phenazine biosynthesis protein [Elainellaceae cyanobacterium]